MLVLSPLETGSRLHRCAKQSGHSCGVSRSDEGVWHVRCRLKELALDELAALLQDRVTRTSGEPVTFEFQL